MEAGRELNNLVATRVMGWRRHRTNQWDDQWYDGEKAVNRFVEGGGGDYYHPDEAWEPSERFDHAWEAVEKLRWFVRIDWNGSVARATLTDPAMNLSKYGEGVTVAEALAIALLAAVGAELPA